MKNTPLILGSILAIGIIAVVICVGMVTGSSSAKPFISVDPVSDKNTGDRFDITGTTSLPAGTELLFEVYPSSFVPQTTDPETGAQSGLFTGATGVIKVTGGTGGINTWSFDLDTSTFAPKEYLVNVSQVAGDLAKGDYRTGPAYGTAVFNVMAPYKPVASAVSPAPASVTFKPIGDRKSSVNFTITGITSLPEGRDLFWEIIPDPGTAPTGLDMQADVGIMANNVVIPGDAKSNRISLDVNMTEFKKGKYLVMVASLSGNPATVDPATGTLAGYTYFNLV